MAVRTDHWFICDGGFTERCVQSPNCRGAFGMRKSAGAVWAVAVKAGWRLVRDVRGDVHLCPACWKANFERWVKGV